MLTIKGGPKFESLSDVQSTFLNKDLIRTNRLFTTASYFQLSSSSTPAGNAFGFGKAGGPRLVTTQPTPTWPPDRDLSVGTPSAASPCRRPSSIEPRNMGPRGRR